MAFADLNLAATLWRGRGLRWLAAGADLPPELSLLCQTKSSAIKNQARPANRPTKPLDVGKHRPDRARWQEQQTVQDKRQKNNSAANNSERWQPLAPDALPEPWRHRLAATRKGKVAWTYSSLGQDLASVTDKACETEAEVQARSVRRAFLSSLLRDLGHPAGTHTFWPSCLSAMIAEGNQAEVPVAANAEAFWSGLVHLGCRAVIVMGGVAVRALELPDSARPFGLLRWRGHLVLVLPEVDVLAGDATRYGSTLAFLRNGLGGIARTAR